MPWNNNNAEAAAKAFAQHRHGVKGRGSENGLKDYLKMLSLAQTCRYRDLSFLDFISHKTGIWENIPAERLPEHLPFGRLYTHKLRLENKAEWHRWAETNQRPAFIPNHPDKIYLGKGWISWDDWVSSF